MVSGKGSERAAVIGAVAVARTSAAERGELAYFRTPHDAEKAILAPSLPKNGNLPLSSFVRDRVG